jgi:hypothetical protein
MAGRHCCTRRTTAASMPSGWTRASVAIGPTKSIAAARTALPPSRWWPTWTPTAWPRLSLGSWVQKGTNLTGKLHILDYLSNPLHEVDLPLAFGGNNWNGALPAPTPDNLDADPDLEVVLNTASSGLVAYDLPGTAGARVLWGTGRGNYQRTE